jgi:hypothetical protein
MKARELLNLPVHPDGPAVVRKWVVSPKTYALIREAAVIGYNPSMVSLIIETSQYMADDFILFLDKDGNPVGGMKLE